MNQPTRWLDDLDSPAEIRELLREGSRPPRFPKVALAAAIIPLAQQAALASTWTLSSTALIALKATSVGLAIGLGSFAAVTALPGLAHRHTNANGTESAAVARTKSHPLNESNANRAAPPGAGSHVALETDPATAVTADGATAVTADGATAAMAMTADGATAVSTASKSTTANGIAAEAQLLERARSWLDADPERALLLTVEHRQRFDKGQMVAERELIAIDALLRLGRTSEAQRRAEPFLADRASQVFAQRLRNLLDRHAR